MSTKILPRDEFTSIIDTEFAPGQWITITQQQISAFADCTDDHQFIHVNPEKAAETALGGTIAHGFLTLSLLPTLVQEFLILPENTVMGMNYGFDKVRFLSPVRSGKRIRAHARYKTVEPKGNKRFLTAQEITVEIEGEEKPALVAEWLNMLITA